MNISNNTKLLTSEKKEYLESKITKLMEYIDDLEVEDLSYFIRDYDFILGREGLSFNHDFNNLVGNIRPYDVFEAAKLGGAELDADYYAYDKEDADYYAYEKPDKIRSFTEREAKIKLIKFINENIKKEEI